MGNGGCSAYTVAPLCHSRQEGELRDCVCQQGGDTCGLGVAPCNLGRAYAPPPPPAICGLGALIFGGIIRHLGMEKAAQGSQQTVLRPVGAATLDQTGPCWRLSQNSQLA